jgi:RND superfamily putative drug exporter
MSRLLYRVGKFCAEHRKSVAATWLAAVAAIAIAAVAIGSQTSDDLTLPGTGSTNATDLLGQKLPTKANGTVPIVLRSGQGRLDSGANKKAVDDTVKSLKRNENVQAAVNPLSDEGSAALSKDGRIAYISVTLDQGPGDLDVDEANSVIDSADPATKAGLDVSAGGYLGQEVSKPSTHVSEVIGIAAAVVILLLSLGTVYAMALPIAVAITGVIAGLSAIALLGHVISVPSVAPTLGTMIGLGVGIDYSLFIVTRYRARLADGYPVEEAIGRSTATSGSAVAFAGSTVIIALLSLLFADIPIVSALGYSAAIVVAIAVMAAVTLMPALLALLGMRIEAHRVPIHAAHAHDDRPHGWARWAHGVARHAWLSAALATALLLLLAAPVLDIRLGQQDVGQLPKSTTARQAYDALAQGFGIGTNGPFLVAVEMKPPAHNDQKSLNQLNQKEQRQQQQAEQQAQQAADQETQQLTQQLIDEGVPPDEAQAEASQQAQADAKKQEAAAQPSAKKQQQLDEQKAFLKSPESDPRLVKLQNKIKKTKDVKSVGPADVDKSGTAAVFSAIPTTAPSAEATSDLIRDLRDDVIPDALKGTQLTAYVGGTTAGYIDLADRIGDKLPSVILIVVALSFVLLMTAFRSILVPLTAALMNLLSVAASYGVLTAVFEKGWGSSLIGLDHSIPIVSFVPLLMFAILFGLSMDYQVFLVSRIDELYKKTGDNLNSVVDGLASSARVITSAALIMVSVFLSFVLNGDPTVKQFGVGLAVAIAVDATIVRCLLVPAVMVKLGKSNWWFPGWLDRVLPRVGLESEEGLPETQQAPPPAPKVPEAVS